MFLLKKSGLFNGLTLALGLLSTSGFAEMKILTTTTDLRVLCSEVAGRFATVESIAKGTQDPHFIEAKPSFMVKASQADLIVSNGLDLEVGWLPNILTGARNPKIKAGGKGNLEIGPLVEPLEVPTGKISRADGDVHPFGNPHFMLDPVRAASAARAVAKRLA